MSYSGRYLASEVADELAGFIHPSCVCLALHLCSKSAWWRRSNASPLPSPSIHSHVPDPASSPHTLSPGTENRRLPRQNDATSPTHEHGRTRQPSPSPSPPSSSKTDKQTKRTKTRHTD
ncbi:hypothetical protein P171DRAFT_429033 [Karstenula rhodostoma CBS 690.94]|uniref:Uncharacterized protein n=1 Tax=Karstenula rhodostoma CBS 690.94 TaxID=1392251 RepID=A0A9P4PQY7_9PLEO|nr:hypothetical protein P171DRAFT_429033 [Karstenula rhodostoma CBS 690.94]